MCELCCQCANGLLVFLHGKQSNCSILSESQRLPDRVPEEHVQQAYLALGLRDVKQPDADEDGIWSSGPVTQLLACAQGISACPGVPPAAYGVPSGKRLQAAPSSFEKCAFRNMQRSAHALLIGKPPRGILRTGHGTLHTQDCLTSGAAAPQASPSARLRPSPAALPADVGVGLGHPSSKQEGWCTAIILLENGQSFLRYVGKRYLSIRNES